MENIKATNIERGIVINPSKKVKISKWEELMKNANEFIKKVDLEKNNSLPNLIDEPNWEVVTNSFENVEVEKNAKPIRIASQGYNNMEIRGNKVREDNDIEMSNVDYSIPTFDYSENKTLEDYGYSEDFSKAVESTIDSYNIDNTPEPNFEIPKFEEYEKEDNSEIEISTPKEEKGNDLDFEEMIRKALDETLKKEEVINKEAPKFIEEENKEENNFPAGTLQINDIMQELAQLSESNDSLKGSIQTLKNRNIKMEKSIEGIENETKNYDEISLKNAKELLLRAKEEQQILREQEEDVINIGKNLKDRLITADEANLSAKKRSDYLSEMLYEHNYQQEEDNVKTYAA